ncbi:hypothetical protein SSBR45G_25740 [Bradyrhizobium sp. SSBR45G]|uniref:hypothetical protein n=1 Tax=unclassified Bradyrhizobium TaxID=2631580 RepID=UPI00234293FF|nr:MULTISPECIES: hypothetical protein [unclassified Bradyrhizobium]GLH77666.1 hypothetical protein SSBR45G_25740 [Bradyrhizobium sp. SSBR45G]GLH84903.1 hypothetical protein SSBR45R_23630 [Bradyrhizobium sp. SSBR45R]
MARIIRFAACAAVLTVAALSHPAPARAAGFDGAWTVLIITEAGSCDQGYSFPLQISGGRVTSTGSANVTGAVGRGGAVTVRVSQGGSYASGTGRLGATSGFGRWSGKGGSGTCSGRWQATRS